VPPCFISFKMKKEQKTSGTSPRAKNLSARLAAVQGVYQSIHNAQSLQSVYEEHLLHRNPPPVDEGAEKMVQPDGTLLKLVLLGIQEQRADIDKMIKASLTRNKEPEPLLYSILLCGACELLMNTDTDVPIIINDYLNVTHSFYEHGEVSLVNGVLDAIAKSLRQG
jgi:transcription antitermination protein NusB